MISEFKFKTFPALSGFLLACALIVLATMPGDVSGARVPSLIEYIEDSLVSDGVFTEAQQQRYLGAFRQELAGYSRDILRDEREAAAEVLLRVVTEGSFDEADIERTVEIASEAYIAISRGADPDAVEGIALYGFSKNITGDDMETLANGYQDCVRFGVPDYLAEDLVFNAVERGWDHYTFTNVKWVLVDAAKAGYPQEEFYSYFMSRFNDGGIRPGALGSEAMAFFRDAARKGIKPDVPKYEGSFIPRAGDMVEPVPEVFVPEELMQEPETEPEADKTKRRDLRVEKKVPVPEAVTPEKKEHIAPKKLTKKTAKKKPRPDPKSKKKSGILQVLERAWKTFIGTPYVWGGETRRGADCSGFVQSVFRESGIRLPRVTREQWRVGTEVSKSRLKKGDLVFFRTVGKRISHVGIVTNPASGQFVHASSSRGVVIDKLSIRYFKARYAGARRVLPAGAQARLNFNISGSNPLLH
jgi:cell wall-associated NlpC family hydrolase